MGTLRTTGHHWRPDTSAQLPSQLHGRQVLWKVGQRPGKSAGGGEGEGEKLAQGREGEEGRWEEKKELQKLPAWDQPWSQCPAIL